MALGIEQVRAVARLLGEMTISIRTSTDPPAGMSKLVRRHRPQIGLERSRVRGRIRMPRLCPVEHHLETVHLTGASTVTEGTTDCYGKNPAGPVNPSPVEKILPMAMGARIDPAAFSIAGSAKTQLSARTIPLPAPVADRSADAIPARKVIIKVPTNDVVVPRSSVPLGGSVSQRGIRHRGDHEEPCHR